MKQTSNRIGVFYPSALGIIEKTQKQLLKLACCQTAYELPVKTYEYAKYSTQRIDFLTLFDQLDDWMTDAQKGSTVILLGLDMLGVAQKSPIRNVRRLFQELLCRGFSVEVVTHPELNSAPGKPVPLIEQAHFIGKTEMFHKAQKILEGKTKCST